MTLPDRGSESRTIRFSPQMASAMAEMAQAANITEARLIQNALSLYWWAYREQTAGHKLLIQRGDRMDAIREVVVADFKRG